MTRAEQQAFDYVDSIPDGGTDMHPWNDEDIERAYQTGYEQAEKDMIERACKWLFSHLPILVDYYDEDIHTGADRSEFIKLFRTQMEE